MSLYTITSIVLFIMLFIREKKFSGYIAASAYHVMSRELENCVLRHSRVFIHTYIYKQPMLTKYRNYNNFEKILCSYLRYTERILGVFLLLLAVISSQLHKNPRRKHWVKEKSTKNNLGKQFAHHFFGCTPSFLCCFLPIFCLLPPFSLLDFT